MVQCSKRLSTVVSRWIGRKETLFDGEHARPNWRKLVLEHCISLSGMDPEITNYDLRTIEHFEHHAYRRSLA